jgi:hypothetical protein
VVVAVVVCGVTVSVVVVECVEVVADAVVVTVFVLEVGVVVVVSEAAVAVSALVFVVGVVCEIDCAVLVICVRVFEMLLAMPDAPPEPHPAVRTVTMPASAIRYIIERSRALPRTLVTLPRIERPQQNREHQRGTPGGEATGCGCSEAVKAVMLSYLTLGSESASAERYGGP